MKNTVYTVIKSDVNNHILFILISALVQFNEANIERF